MLKFISAFLLFTSVLFAQNSVLISMDNEPSTFAKYDAKVFSLGDSKNIAAWIDYRDGNASYYAQFFDDSGNLIGDNFKVAGNTLFIPQDDVGFLNLYEGYSTFFDNSVYTIGLGIYDGDNQLIRKQPLRSVDLGWCGTGYLGIYTDIILKDEYFILVGSYNGIHERRFYNYSGEEITDLGDGVENEISYQATLSSTAANSAGQYANLYIDIEYYEEYTLKCDIYNEDNVLIDSLSIQEITTESELWSLIYEEVKVLRVISDPDDNFVLIWIDPSDGKIHYTKITPQGEFLFSKPKIINFVENLELQSIKTFSITPYYNDTTRLLLSYSVDEGSYGGRYIHAIIKFDKDFNLIEEESEINNLLVEIPHQPVFSNNQNLFLGRIKNNNVYLSSLDNFYVIDEKKINDDLFGTNQYFTSMRYIDEDKFIVSWKDDEGWKGREIDESNNFISEQINLPNQNVIYTDDGYKFIPYTKGNNNQPRSAGFRVYNENWDLEKWVRIDTTQGAYISFHWRKLNENEVIFASSHNDTLLLSKYNHTGTLTLQKRIPYEEKINSIGIFAVTDSTYFIRSNEKGLLYNINFERESEQEVDLPFGFEFTLEENKLVTLIYHYDSYRYDTDLLIETFDGDTVAFMEDIIGWGEPINLIKINDEEFLLTYRKNNQFWGKVYNGDGGVLRGEFQIATSVENSTKDLAAGIGKNKIRFAWAEARVPGEGYNIYSSIYDNALITSVDEFDDDLIPINFVLHQNYPNPFNPSTKITFNIPLSNNDEVVLRIYNSIGQEVKTILNRRLTPGNHNIDFDGAGLSSGVYFYQLKAGDFVQTKKMVLLK